jgi:hypothetical protein
LGTNPKVFFYVRVLGLSVVREVIQYRSIVHTIGWEGMDFEESYYTQIEADFLVFYVGEEGMLLLSIQLLVNTYFEVLKEGKSIQ